MRALCLTCLLIACLAWACSDAPAPEQASTSRDWTKCETLAMIQGKQLNESSGIAVDRQEEGVYYTHNDSGDTARFFKFDRKGEIQGIYNATNAKATDWEDMASATVKGKPYLFFGDIGDNAGVRKNIVVYRVPQPTKAGEVRADQTYTLTYPDEPHNAEALMVHPTTGDIYVVTKAATKPSGVFRLRSPGASGSFKMEKLGEVQLAGPSREGKLVTGGDISPDGKHVVLRSYLKAWEFDAPANFEDWHKQTPRPIQTNFEFGGEAICYSKDGKSLLTSSEGTPCQISEAKLR